MTFLEALKHITREQRPKRALEWMERFIKAIPIEYSNDKKFLKNWFTNKDDLDQSAADNYRGWFADWKREEKSRSARHSGSFRKPRRRLKKESKDIIETVIRESQH